MKDLLTRNLLGFLLLAIGVGLVLLGTHAQIPKLADAGFGFIAMAGLALQVSIQHPKEPATTAPTP
jgi:hypothetical protein